MQEFLFNEELSDLNTKQGTELFVDILHGDCLRIMKTFEEDSVHFIITDPPYFLDGLNTDWKKGGEDIKLGTGSVGGLPSGMKFDPKQGKKLQVYMNTVGNEMYRILKPGGFCVVFSQPRLVHRLAVGIEDSGFEIRDLLAWRFTKKAQFKAFSMNHFIERMNIPKNKKEQLKSYLQGRKTPQLRPQFENMVLAQKPKDGTFIKNWLKHETGLIDPMASLNGNTPSTLMTVEKPIKDIFNNHLTVKPVDLIKHLIKLFSIPDQVVLDPFLGSGTTALACLETNRSCIGIEIQKKYIEITKQRLKKFNHS